MNKTLGMIMIGLGAIALVWGTFTFTTREKVVDIGPIHASRDKSHNVYIPPIAGAVLVAGGFAVMLAGKKV